MNKTFLLMLALAAPAYVNANARLRITSNITVDDEHAGDLLNKADEFNAEYAKLRGVMRAETTIENDDAVRCSECGGEVAEGEGEVTEEGNRKCSSCCSSCKPCCK